MVLQDLASHSPAKASAEVVKVQAPPCPCPSPCFASELGVLCPLPLAVETGCFWIFFLSECAFGSLTVGDSILEDTAVGSIAAVVLATEAHRSIADDLRPDVHTCGLSLAATAADRSGST